ncbi:unnamed protein product [Tuber aestivum]|uniref:Proline dehydrogenase n=1 Tax=Tuber aestivum TaxID=59557 RepID=A0A292Q581_9PEZI|nr:unnamed protein product [Tuber aestivum]
MRCPEHRWFSSAVPTLRPISHDPPFLHFPLRSHPLLLFLISCTLPSLLNTRSALTPPPLAPSTSTHRAHGSCIVLKEFMALHQTRMLLLTRTVPLVALARPPGVLRLASTISTPSSNVIRPPPQEAPELPRSYLMAPTPVTTSDYPLARLSTGSLFRAMLLHTITASPILHKLGTGLITMNLNNLKNGGFLKWGVDKTFYPQFCAGSTSAEIAATISELRSLGLAGVILAYAREAEITDTAVSPENQSQQIKQWLDGSLKTIACVEPGDYVAIKYSGAGLSSLPLLNQHRPCFEYPELGDALLKMCDAAKAKGVQILIDAEQASVQDGVHDWSLVRFVAELGGRLPDPEQDVLLSGDLVSTFQYLKASPEILCRHIRIAHEDNFTLGVKLVRGAYLHTDPRHLIHDTKEDTDRAYDDTIRLLLTGSPTREPGRASFYDPPVARYLPGGIGRTDLVVASHNRESVELALALRRQLGSNSRVGELTYAQLMGMADELSLGLLSRRPDDEEIKVYKYAVWGTTQECVKYLVRRAEENKSALGRTSENRAACMKEIWRRMRFVKA